MQKSTLPTGEDLRDINALQALESHVKAAHLRVNVTDLEKLAKSMGTSGTYLFRYLRNDWRASEKAMRSLEARVMDYLNAAASAEEPVATPNAKLISSDFIVAGVRRFLEHVRLHCYIGVGYGPAGAGKTKGCEIHAAQHAINTIYIHLSMWKGGRHDLVRLIKKAAGITRVPGGVKVEDHLVERLKGSGKLLVIDNAHRMTEASRRFLADFWEESHLAIALIGNPEIRDQFAKNDQHGSRIGIERDVSLDLAKHRTATAKHLLTLHLPEAVDVPEITKDATAMLEGFGLCRSVEKRAALARTILLTPNNSVNDPVVAWRMAKEQLPQLKAA